MTALQLDLHTHLKIARRVAFSVDHMPRYAAALKSRGLDGLAITEHAHGAGFWSMLEALRARFTYQRGRFEVEGALFYPGFELTLAEDVDVLVIGPVDSLRRLDGAFAHPATAGYHPEGQEFADAVAAVAPEALRIAAHPARDDKHIDRLCLSVRKAVFHAAEINARYVEPTQVDAVRTRAARKGWAVTGGSDAHAWPQLGACWTKVEARSDSFDDVRDAILAGDCNAVVHPQRERLVRVGHKLKAHIKSRSPKIERLPWRTSKGVRTKGAPAVADRLFEPSYA